MCVYVYVYVCAYAGTYEREHTNYLEVGMYITFVFLDTRPYEWPGQAKQKSTRKYRWGMTNLQRRGCLQSALPLSGDDLGGHASSRFVNSLVYLESYILEGRESRVDGSASGCSIQPASQPASQPDKRAAR